MVYYTYSTTGKPSALYRQQIKKWNGTPVASGKEQQITFLNQKLAIESRWLACRAIGIIYHPLIVEIKLRDGLARQYRRDGFSGYTELVERLSARCV